MDVVLIGFAILKYILHLQHHLSSRTHISQVWIQKDPVMNADHTNGIAI